MSTAPNPNVTHPFIAGPADSFVVLAQLEAVTRQRDELAAALRGLLDDIDAGRMLTANRTAKAKAALAGLDGR